MHKIKIKIILIIVGLLILFVPFSAKTYKDGGTKTYTSLTYKMIFWNELQNGNPYARKVFQLVLFPNNFKSIDDIEISRKMPEELVALNLGAINYIDRFIFEKYGDDAVISTSENFSYDEYYKLIKLAVLPDVKNEDMKMKIELFADYLKREYCSDVECE